MTKYRNRKVTVDGLTPGEVEIVYALRDARKDGDVKPIPASDLSRRLGMARLSIKVMICSIRRKRPDITIGSLTGAYGGYWLSNVGFKVVDNIEIREV